MANGTDDTTLFINRRRHLSQSFIFWKIPHRAMTPCIENSGVLAGIDLSRAERLFNLRHFSGVLQKGFVQRVGEINI
jgi:hypothetical protein